MTLVCRRTVWLWIVLAMPPAAMVHGDRTAFPAAAEAYEPSSKGGKLPAVEGNAHVLTRIPEQDAEAPPHPFFRESSVLGVAPRSVPNSVSEAQAAGSVRNDVEAAQSEARERAGLELAMVENARHRTPRPRGLAAVGIAVGCGGTVAVALLVYLRSSRRGDEELSGRGGPLLRPGVNLDGSETLGPPEYLRYFGLDVTASEADVVRAYRQHSWQLHPDRGGDAAEFKAMQRRFEQSIAFVRRRARAHRIESL